MNEQDPRYYTNILLEEIRSQFQALGERVEDVATKGDETNEMVGKLAVDMEEVKMGIGILKRDVSTLKSDVGQLKDDMHEVKEELHVVRNELKVKVDRDEFVLLEQRVQKLEKLTLRTA